MIIVPQIHRFDFTAKHAKKALSAQRKIVLQLIKLSHFTSANQLIRSSAHQIGRLLFATDSQILNVDLREMQ